MKKIQSVTVIILVLFLISTTGGCSSNRILNTGAGAGIGAGVAYLLSGGTPEAMILFAVFGGVIGYSLTHKDRENINETLEAGRSGVTQSWRSNDGLLTATPSPAFVDEGRDCRNVEISFVVNGKTNHSTQKMCREADRSNWMVASN